MRPDLLVFRGHAKDWDDKADAAGFPVDNIPQAGDIVVFEPEVFGADSKYGHVAYVESVNGTAVSISELNFGLNKEQRSLVHRRTIVISTNLDLSFIHRGSGGGGEQAPPPTATKKADRPTSTPKPEPTKTVPIQGPNMSDPASIAKWLSDAVSSGNYAAISQLVGPEGAIFSGYGHGFEPTGYNNGKDFAKRLGLALANSHPVCLGYRLEGDSNNRFSITFSNAHLDEQVTGLQQQDSITLFLFFKNGNRYELEVVVPVDNYGGWEIEYETSNLSACR